MLTFLLFVFCATFAVGQGEKCLECSGAAWANCVGQEHTCRVSEKCVSAVSVLTQDLSGQDKVPIKKVSRRCADRTLCEKDFSVNFRVADWKIKTKCGENVTMGNEKHSEGKLVCYGCVSDPYYCTKTVKCSETETMCISASETVAGNLVVSKGCATKTMCDLRRDILDVVGFTVVGHVSCCQGNLCNGSGVLTSTSSVCLLLLSMLPWMLP
ncbi:hypothetical protein AALO_G00081910 [Alosa alosa]|uniref:Snake toxin/toxin-like domain-containing protein n=1 Tax=Alosa alosa TaxID=278164 RepID=A0AAV6H2H7_9TELE|nr:uncharacterized protein LOC125296276 [Alosa alosa]KAG5279817.1 hypothetical protein AALO_G00081910 [Alosa alosa]